MITFAKTLCMSVTFKKWAYLFTLSIIWGSSYILIKKGLVGLTPLQVGSFRILFTTVILLAFGYKTLKGLSREQWKWIAHTGFYGTFFPTFLFSFAETEVDSSVASVLNGLTPLFALLVAVVFVGVKFNKLKVYGVIVGLLGAFFLIVGQELNFDIKYTSLAVLAAVCYGINVNIIKQKLNDYPPRLVAALPLAIISIIGVGVMLYLGFDVSWDQEQDIKSLVAIVILAVVGTSLSLVMFNRLIQQTNTVFATSVTYLIPIVALFWGFLANETISSNQMIGLGFILIAIWLIRKDK